MECCAHALRHDGSITLGLVHNEGLELRRRNARGIAVRDMVVAV
jgi:hypothetical protein